MTEQAIESRDLTVTDIFQDFYRVPDYQREYVWKTEHVEQLLNDINAELAINDPDKAPEYFIGSIVVCPGNNSVLELIDGQQRMTTPVSDPVRHSRPHQGIRGRTARPARPSDRCHMD